jgi:hypothetical protein
MKNKQSKNFETLKNGKFCRIEMKIYQNHILDKNSKNIM